jgi:hypothetical protein
LQHFAPASAAQGGLQVGMMQFGSGEGQSDAVLQAQLFPPAQEAEHATEPGGVMLHEPVPSHSLSLTYPLQLADPQTLPIGQISHRPFEQLPS